MFFLRKERRGPREGLVIIVLEALPPFVLNTE